jgi:hypothetical protein
MADDPELAAALLDVVAYAAQLRDLLAAKQSAEVTHEADHRVCVLPHRVGRHRITFRIEETKTADRVFCAGHANEITAFC